MQSVLVEELDVGVALFNPAGCPAEIVVPLRVEERPARLAEVDRDHRVTHRRSRRHSLLRTGGDAEGGREHSCNEHPRRQIVEHNDLLSTSCVKRG